MATWLKQSTAIEIKVGPFVDATDGVTAETLLTITSSEALLAKNAGDWTAKTEATSLVHESNGWYRCLLDATDTNTLGILLLQIAESGALPVWREFMVIAANVYDSIVGGGDILDVSATQILGTAIFTPATAGILDVNVKNIDNDAASASGTVTFPNATLASTTNITAGTIATVTNVTTVNGLAANVITAAATATDFGTEVAAAVWGDTVAGDFTVAASVGKSVMNGVALGTGLTVARAVNVTTVDALAANVITAASMNADASAEIADAVWDEDATGHQAQGTFGQAIGDPAADTNTIFKAVVTDATGATVGVDVVAVKAETVLILEDTGTTLQAEVDGIQADTEDIQTRIPAALSAGGNIKADVLSLGGVVQSLTDLKDFADDGYDPATNKVQGVVLTDTLTTYTGNTVQTGDSFARIGVAGAGLTNIDLPNQTMDIVGNITGNLSGTVGSVTGAVGSVTGAVGSVAAGGITAASIATGAIDADAIAADAVTELRAIVSGTADSGTTTTMVDAARTEADTDYWKDMAILFTSGTISGQARLITAFTPGTDTVTFSPAVTQAVGTNTYEIISNVAAAGATAPTAAEVADAVWDEDATAHQTGGTFGQAIGDPGADANTIFKAVVTDAAGATVGVDVVAVKAETAAILEDTGTTLQAEVDGIQAKTDLIPASPASTTNITAGTITTVTNLTNAPTAGDLTATMKASVVTATTAGTLDLAAGVETGLTLREAIRLLTAADAGKLSGAATTTITIRNAVADSKNRITATVDSDGNRSAITYDLT